MKCLLQLVILCFLNCNNPKTEYSLPSLNETKALKDYKNIHNEAEIFCTANQFNEDYYFLVDLSEHSGRNRFFIYDFKSKKVIDKNLVTHGSCDVFGENINKWKKVKFDNRNNSHCSMKGKFKVGKRDYSSWGINVKYWLHGLEETNKSAVERVVVLHSWNAVKNNEIYPKYSPLSWGCPAVSNEFMKVLDSKLKNESKPVLLWIIE